MINPWLIHKTKGDLGVAPRIGPRRRTQERTLIDAYTDNQPGYGVVARLGNPTLTGTLRSARRCADRGTNERLHGLNRMILRLQNLDSLRFAQFC